MHDLEGITFVVLAVVCLVFAGGMWYGTSSTQNEAVERQLGLYCADTGDFAWKDECGKGL
jgi:hypothetical protein